MEQLGKYGFLRRDYLKNLKKKLTTLQAQDAEIRIYEEKIHHIADKMISIDLDDGVKKNCAIFQDVLYGNKVKEGLRMMADEKIKNSNELEFAVFCIENVAAKLGVDTERVYQAFTQKDDILNGYIVPEYKVLHTQSREYIVDDLLDVMKERNVEITHSNKNDQNEHSSAMTANPILLQKKYSRVIECFAKQHGLSLDAALDFFYRSEVYQLIRDGVSDMHCMSDAYLADELEQEYSQNIE